ncbi:hypothetical protein SAMN02910278_01869 [Peptostreptococcus sp. D1]|nr:hypothetical protein SAMN02910278_01869 [Peptostreptococcus sp. D1]
MRGNMIKIKDLINNQMVRVDLNGEMIIGEVRSIYKSLRCNMDSDYVIIIKLKNNELRKIHQSEIHHIELIHENKEKVISEEQFCHIAGKIIGDVVDERQDIRDLLIVFTGMLAGELFKNNKIEGINDNQFI